MLTSRCKNRLIITILSCETENLQHFFASRQREKLPFAEYMVPAYYNPALWAALPKGRPLSRLLPRYNSTR